MSVIIVKSNLVLLNRRSALRVADPCDKSLTGTEVFRNLKIRKVTSRDSQLKTKISSKNSSFPNIQ